MNESGGSLNDVMDRAIGAYLGLAIGDALGATVEFMTVREIRSRFADEGGLHRHIVGGGWLKLAPGQVTDDTTMSLALGDALLRCPTDASMHAARHVADAFVAWLRSKPVDCGNTCRRGIQRYIAEGTLSGPPNDGDAGNGAVMRNLPVVLATLYDEPALEATSLMQARMTHHHPLSDAAVLGLGRLTRLQVLGAGPHSILAAIDAFVAEHPRFRYAPYPGRASAYVVDTMQTVLHCYTSHADFDAALVAAVNCGEDADTTGALVGMLAGARCGARCLPRRLLSRLAPTVVRAVTDQASALVALSLTRREESVPAPPLASCA